MRTNTARQQATRRMTAEQKSYNMAADLSPPDHAVNEAHAARFRAIQSPCGSTPTPPA